MKMRVVFLWAIVIACSFISAEAREIQKPEWKGKVEIENGVQVIKNPKLPLYPAGICRLEEELSLGEAEGEEAYLFSRISGLDVVVRRYSVHWEFRQ